MLGRRAILYLPALAVACALAAPVTGPIRALVLFVALVAVIVVGLGAFLLFMYFFWPDTNGENWFTYRKRR
ncbi:MAG TPA: hypothetical protein VFY18_10375 [Candidatus Limnocylindrales bacterium]|nr:hypothetical protein [Candidatus Limnocylindrales bacterium]